MRFSKRLVVAAVALAVVSGGGVAMGAGNGSGTATSSTPLTPFERTVLRLDYDSTKNEAQVFINPDIGAGLRSLDVFDPNGVKILHLAASDSRNLGLTEIWTESHEGKSPRQVKKAYPEGTYTFRGRTFEGDTLVGAAVLSHDLLAAPVITAPADKATNVCVNGLVGSWQPVPGATVYHIKLETGDVFSDTFYFPDLLVTADLLPISTSFAFPDGSILPDKDYAFEVSAEGPNGNTIGSAVEFHTSASC